MFHYSGGPAEIKKQPSYTYTLHADKKMSGSENIEIGRVIDGIVNDRSKDKLFICSRM